MTLTATAPAADERVAKKSTLSKLLGRPEIGALVGAIALFIFFAAVAPVFLQPGSIATVLYGASTIGIMAVLLSGTEADVNAAIEFLRSKNVTVEPIEKSVVEG